MLVFSGPTLLRNYCLWMCHQTLQCTAAGHHTMNTFFRILAWSLNALYEGEWPTHDWNGEPLVGGRRGELCGGYFLVLWALTSDNEHNTKVYELANVTSNSPCPLCPCDSGANPWWNFQPNARWTKLIYTVAFWTASGYDKCPIFSVYGVSVLTVYPDYMHCKYLGIDKILLGSVLWMLIHWVLSPDLGDLEARLTLVWRDIFDIYKRRHTENRYGLIKLSMFTTKSQPKLKGKAAEVRDIGPVLLEVWRKYMNPDMAIHKKIEIMLEGSAHLDFLLEEHKDAYAFPEAAAKDMETTAFVYLATWVQVAEHYKKEKEALFGLTAKAHLLAHICLMARLACFLTYRRGLWLNGVEIQKNAYI